MLQRNLRNELIVAFGAIICLFLIILFAILLSKGLDDLIEENGSSDVRSLVADDPLYAASLYDAVTLAPVILSETIDNSFQDGAQAESVVNLPEHLPQEDIVSVETNIPNSVRLSFSETPTNVIVTHIPGLTPSNIQVETTQIGRSSSTRIGCEDPRTQITSPIALQHLSGVFSVYGTADRNDLQYYQIEIRPDSASLYNTYLGSELSVSNGFLGEINSNDFDAGLYWIRLSIVNIDVQIPRQAICEILVVFE